MGAVTTAEDCEPHIWDFVLKESHRSIGVLDSVSYDLIAMLERQNEGQ
jgi:hypothetical protein